MNYLIIEVASHKSFLSARRGLLDVSIEGDKIASIPFDDLAAVVITGRGVVFSIDCITRLGEFGVPVVCCGRKFRPSSIVWPMSPSSINSKRMRCQIEASAPTMKSAWKKLVIAKINWQWSVLEDRKRPFLPVKRLAGIVRSGDPANVEAQAARHYWRLLFGKGFRRDQTGSGLNAALNYGYAIIRAATARAVAAAGLHPAVSLMHRNAHNSYGLVDDLMEPFRPLVDRWVFINQKNIEGNELTDESKKCLVALLHEPVMMKGTTPLMTLIYQTATNYGMYLEKKSKLILPDPTRRKLHEIDTNETLEWIQSDVDACYV